MGQQEVSTSDNMTIKVTQLPKLESDGENWLTYYERVLNAATACGLRRHLIGTALRPTDLVEKAGKFYLSATATVPLSDDDVDKHETSIDSWEQKEAQVRELIYNTVDNSSFLQIKGGENSCRPVEKAFFSPWQQRCSVRGVPARQTSDGPLCGERRHAHSPHYYEHATRVP